MQKGRTDWAAWVKDHRWSVLAAGAAIQLFTGIPAAWGVFQPSVQQEYGFEESTASMAFYLLISAFGVGSVLGGWLGDKKGPRTAAYLGSALVTGGFVAAGFVPAERPWLFYLLFSVPVGMGCAFLYPAVMTCAQHWYAQKKGLATGVIGLAVGLSGGALTLLVRFVGQRWGIRVCFWVLAGIIGLLCGIGSFFLVLPKGRGAEQDKGRSLRPGQMLKTWQYWILLVIVAMATPSVLLFSPQIVELAQQRGLEEQAAYWAVVIGSACSALGRLSVTWLSDRIGRRRADRWVYGALTLLSIGFIWTKGYWLLAGYGALTFFYAAQGALLPSLSTDLFGMKFAGVNYGFVALGMTAGSLGFGLVSTGWESMLLRHLVAVGASLLGFGLLFALRPVKQVGNAENTQ